MRKSLWIKCCVAAIVLGVVAALIWRRGPHALQTGDRLPAFTLQQADRAGLVSISDNKHDVVLVNFWATWCPPCVEETPSLEKFAREMAPRGVRVIGVSVDQNTSQLQGFIAKYHLSYSILRDPDQNISARFGTYKFPETYIFDRDGRLADKIIGATDWSDPRMVQFVSSLADWKHSAPQQAAAAASAY